LVEKIKRFLPSKRRIIQLYAALLYNAHLKGFITGEIYTGKSKLLCVPGLNCYSCPGAVGACPLGALQNAVAASGNRIPAYVLGIILLYGVMLGRTVCGWLCPFGLIQDILHKIPTPKIRKSRVTRLLSGLKYVILLIFVIGLPLYHAFKKVPLPAFCKYICPAGTLEGAVALLSHPENEGLFPMLGALFTGKFVILLIIVGLCIFAYRAFCRFLCPLGAIYGLFSKLNIIGVKVEKDKCISCGKCIAACKTDVCHVGDRECISCGDCISCCPTGAISLRAGKIKLITHDKASETKNLTLRIIAWASAAVILACALYFSGKEEEVPVPPVTVTTTVPSSTLPGITSVGLGRPGKPFGTTAAEMGGEVGMTAPDFTVPLYGGGSFSLSESRGKVTVLNFWATWCGPCVEELPYFDALHAAHSNDVFVIAIHSDLVTDDVDKYLSGFDYSMPFALDQSGEVIAGFGGGTMLPQTVILDAEGKVVYNAVGSLTYEKLEELIQTAKKDTGP